MIKTDFNNFGHAQHSDKSLPFGAGIEVGNADKPGKRECVAFSASHQP
jgi:hypothetical protein